MKRTEDSKTKETPSAKEPGKETAPTKTDEAYKGSKTTEESKEPDRKVPVEKPEGKEESTGLTGKGTNEKSETKEQGKDAKGGAQKTVGPTGKAKQDVQKSKGTEQGNMSPEKPKGKEIPADKKEKMQLGKSSKEDPKSAEGRVSPKGAKDNEEPKDTQGTASSEQPKAKGGPEDVSTPLERVISKEEPRDKGKPPPQASKSKDETDNAKVKTSEKDKGPIDEGKMSPEPSKKTVDSRKEVNTPSEKMKEGPEGKEVASPEQSKIRKESNDEVARMPVKATDRKESMELKSREEIKDGKVTVSPSGTKGQELGNLIQKMKPVSPMGQEEVAAGETSPGECMRKKSNDLKTAKSAEKSKSDDGDISPLIAKGKEESEGQSLADRTKSREQDKRAEAKMQLGKSKDEDTSQHREKESHFSNESRETTHKCEEETNDTKKKPSPEKQQGQGPKQPSSDVGAKDTGPEEPRSNTKRSEFKGRVDRRASKSQEYLRAMSGDVSPMVPMSEEEFRHSRSHEESGNSESKASRREPNLKRIPFTEKGKPTPQNSKSNGQQLNPVKKELIRSKSIDQGSKGGERLSRRKSRTPPARFAPASPQNRRASVRKIQKVISPASVESPGTPLKATVSRNRKQSVRKIKKATSPVSVESPGTPRTPIESPRTKRSNSAPPWPERDFLTALLAAVRQDIAGQPAPYTAAQEYLWAERDLPRGPVAAQRWQAPHPPWQYDVAPAPRPSWMNVAPAPEPVPIQPPEAQYYILPAPQAVPLATAWSSHQAFPWTQDTGFPQERATLFREAVTQTDFLDAPVQLQIAGSAVQLPQETQSYSAETSGTFAKDTAGRDMESLQLPVGISGIRRDSSPKPHDPLNPYGKTLLSSDARVSSVAQRLRFAATMAENLRSASRAVQRLEYLTEEEQARRDCVAADLMRRAALASKEARAASIALQEAKTVAERREQNKRLEKYGREEEYASAHTSRTFSVERDGASRAQSYTATATKPSSFHLARMVASEMTLPQGTRTEQETGSEKRKAIFAFGSAAAEGGTRWQSTSTVVVDRDEMPKTVSKTTSTDEGAVKVETRIELEGARCAVCGGPMPGDAFPDLSSRGSDAIAEKSWCSRCFQSLCCRLPKVGTKRPTVSRDSKQVSVRRSFVFKTAGGEREVRVLEHHIEPAAVDVKTSLKPAADIAAVVSPGSLEGGVHLLLVNIEEIVKAKERSEVMEEGEGIPVPLGQVTSGASYRPYAQPDVPCVPYLTGEPAAVVSEQLVAEGGSPAPIAGGEAAPCEGKGEPREEEKIEEQTMLADVDSNLVLFPESGVVLIFAALSLIWIIYLLLAASVRHMGSAQHEPRRIHSRSGSPEGNSSNITGTTTDHSDEHRLESSSSHSYKQPGGDSATVTSTPITPLASESLTSTEPSASPFLRTTVSYQPTSVHVCETDFCLQEASFLNAILSGDPCQNFYNYVCNSVIEKWQPQLGVAISRDTVLAEDLEDRALKTLTDGTHDDMQLVGQLLQECRDSQPPNSDNEIMNIIATYVPSGIWPADMNVSKDEPWSMAGRMMKDLDIEALVEISSCPNRDRGSQAIAIDTPHLLYMEGDSDHILDNIKQAIDDFLTRVLPNATDLDVCENVVGVSRSLSRVSPRALRQQSRLIVSSEVNVAVKQLLRAACMGSVASTILLKSADILDVVTNIVHKNPSAVVDYLVFRLALFFAPFLGIPALTDLFPLTLTVAPSDPERYCSRLVEHVLPITYMRALALQLGQLTLAQVWTSQAESLFLRSLFRLPWLSGPGGEDQVDARLAKEKLQKKIKVAHFFPLRAANEGIWKAYEQQLRAQLSNASGPLGRIWAAAQAREKDSFTGSPFMVQAAYLPARRLLYVPVGVLNMSIPPNSTMFVFHMARYAVRIYRSLLEALRPEDPFSENVPFSSNTNKKLNDLYQCLADDMRLMPTTLKSCFHTEARWNTLLEESVALILTHEAFQEFLNTRRIWGADFRLKGLEQLSSDQLFFAYFALDNCERADEAYAWRGVLAPAQERVNAALRQSEAFAVAFGCKDGEAMKAQRRCPVIGT